MDRKPFDIRDRSFLFARDVILYARGIWRRDPIVRHLAMAAVRSASSTAANLEEAAAAQSRADFISKNSIALKESREATYWLRLTGACEPELSSKGMPLIRESKELSCIIAAIVLRAKKNRGVDTGIPASTPHRR